MGQRILKAELERKVKEMEGKLEELMDVTINYLDHRLQADGKV